MHIYACGCWPWLYIGRGYIVLEHSILILCGLGDLVIMQLMSLCSGLLIVWTLIDRLDDVYRHCWQCLFTSPPEGVARYCFHPVCLSVCLSVCVSVCLSVCVSVCLSVCVSVCPADILVFYFSAIRRDIDLKFIQDTYRVVLKSLQIIDLHRSKVKVTGTVHCFCSHHKNWAIEKFQFFSIDTL